MTANIHYQCNVQSILRKEVKYKSYTLLASMPYTKNSHYYSMALIL